MRVEGDRAEYSVDLMEALAVVPAHQEEVVFVLVTQHVGADFLRTFELGSAKPRHKQLKAVALDSELRADRSITCKTSGASYARSWRRHRSWTVARLAPG